MTTERIVDRLDSVFDLRIHRALNLLGLVYFFDHVYAHGIAYEEKSKLT
jgi:metal-sulfur cluster biosynthetic enzyme